jgi:hypothetical protein
VVVVVIVFVGATEEVLTLEVETDEDDNRDDDEEDDEDKKVDNELVDVELFVVEEEEDVELELDELLEVLIVDAIPGAITMVEGLPIANKT